MCVYQTCAVQHNTPAPLYSQGSSHPAPPTCTEVPLLNVGAVEVEVCGPIQHLKQLVPGPCCRSHIYSLLKHFLQLTREVGKREGGKEDERGGGESIALEEE